MKAKQRVRRGARGETEGGARRYPASRLVVRAPALVIVGIVIVSLVDAVSLHAQANSKTNPYATRADIAEGSTSFRYHCAGCHGPEGKGGRAPDLTVPDLDHGDTAEALFQTVRFGISGTEMRGTRFPDKRVWQIVAYLQSLRQRVSRPNIRGDRLRGKALFEGKGSCTSCHWVNGKGGRLGPELSRIGARRSPGGLSSSLVNPNEEVAPAYWQWRIVDKNGKVINGIRLHEDNFSIRLLDSNENLVSLDKQNVRQIQHRRVSAMPNYGDRLSQEELDDLVAYLYSLR